MLGTEVLNLKGVDINISNYYYIGGLVLGSLIPDLDHHSSILNGKALAVLEVVLKILIAITFYKISLYISLDFKIEIGILILALVALKKANFKKKWALKLMYIFLAFLLASHFDMSTKSLFGAAALICTGCFPHRAFTHRWYGMLMITISLYLFTGFDGLFIGSVIGMLSHIISDKIKSLLQI
ncbi:MAG: hypothetical protein WBA54_01715 [Acidaminobacteraceae bacterium]